MNSDLPSPTPSDVIDPTSRELRASIVITSYNHGRYLRQCVESALMQANGNAQVIVVDDGSSDDSCDILQEYRDRVELVLKDNGGQGSATMAGFEKVTGDIVHFLDSDDFLAPQAIDRVLAAWCPGDAKLQFRLNCVDEDGRLLGPRLPRLLHEGDVTPIVRRFGRFQFSMSSGSAYASAAVRKVLPMNPEQWPIATDYYLSCTCAFLGNIRNLPEPLGYYRVHRKRAKDDDYLRGNADASAMQQFFRYRRQHGFMLGDLKRLGFVRDDTTFDMPPHLAEVQLMVAKTHAEYDPKQWGSVTHATYRAVVSFSSWPGLRTAARLALLSWILVMAAMPRKVAHTLYGWKQNSWTMPAPLRRSVGFFFDHKGKGVP